MQKFLDKYSSYIHGVIHGFDRIILKGHIGDFYYKNGFYYFLSQETVKLKDFKSYALKITDQLKSHVEKTVSETGAYTEYLNSVKASKEDIAKRVAKEGGITEGLICVLSGEYTIRGFRNKDLREKLLKLGLFSEQDILRFCRICQFCAELM